MSSPQKEWKDAVPNYRFYVQLKNAPDAFFTEISGLQIEVTVQDYEEGGNNGFVHRIPGCAKVSNVTLKRGITQKNEFFKWCLNTANGNIKPEDLTIILYDTTGQKLVQWTLSKAFPVKWVAPQLNADSHNVAIETLELAHNGIKQE